MADRTAIEWTDATFNPWWGCERVNPACAHCYADTWARRVGQDDLWGARSRRRFFTETHWRRPASWNKKAEAAGMSLKVFCASMADVFEDRDDLVPWRERLWDTIDSTPWLQWQLLTKRPENVLEMVPESWSPQFPPNVWLGASIENSRHSFRADLLREIPASVRFVSAEPLLSSVFANGGPNRRPLDLSGIHWVIAGGESGPHCRQTDEVWMRELLKACRDSGAAFFLKQLGGHPDKRGKEKALLDGKQWHELPNAPTPVLPAVERG